MTVEPEIKGWCPGARRPMASGDGLLVRAKLVGSALSASQARDIADIASSCGNGLIDLSQRAQMQLRGVSEATLDDALHRLDAIGLLAPDAATESVLNFLTAPLAGLGAGAFDANEIARRLARAITDDPILRALPGKFLFLLDDATALGLADAAADIRLETFGERIAIVVDGARDRAVIVEPDAAIETALTLARAFIALRKGDDFDLRRMRALVAARGADRLLHEAGLVAAPYRSARRAPRWDEIFGVRAVGDIWFAGVGAPLGRWRASDLAALVDMAARDGIGELRLTPWRAILALAPSQAPARRVIDAAGRLDLIVAASDPRLSVAACPGAPECPQAKGVTRAHLDRLAPLAQALAQDGVGLHVSGCAKGCAKPGATSVTLNATGAGFDLIDNGRASDAPTATGLSLEQVERALANRKLEAACPAH
jgi:precorrin-3B synthase